MGVRVFACPQCKETINDTMTQCPYCSAAIDPAAAEAAADFMSKVSDACSEASYLKIMARSIPVSLLISFLPFVSGAANLAFYGLLVAVPFMAYRWNHRFGKIQTDDPDYAQVKGHAKVAILIWAPCFLFGLVSIYVNFFVHHKPIQ